MIVRGLFAFLLVTAPFARAAAGEGGAATVQPLATEAALEAFRRGGNAVDAAAAAAFTLGVVDGHNSGVGGGCFILVRSPDGKIVCLDGREVAPAGASRDMFLREGKVDEQLSKTGPLASGVPGAAAAWKSAVEKFGKLPFADALRAGIRHAREGFPIDEVYARKLKATAADLARFPASKEIFLQPDGQPWPKGHVLVQKDLAASYEKLAGEGTDWFYRGGFAQATADYMKENGGLITAEDFAHYRLVEREPLVTRFREWQIVGVPPPSSGGVHVAQMLNILTHLPQEEPGTPEFTHTVVEAMKLAFADRAYWLGDPAFVSVPKGLVSDDYARQLALRIDPRRATPVDKHADPPDWQSNSFEKHTTHLATADSGGFWVSATATINTAFGSKVVVPGTGILLNDEMDDFSVAPGAPNHFRLVGGEANSVAPGKRPLSSMSPTIVLDAKDRPVMSIGAAGGPTIISQVLLGLLCCLDHDMSPSAALALPRFHHQWRPDQIRLEASMPEKVKDSLRALGHKLDEQKEFGACQIIGQGKDGIFIGASDPRVPGAAGTTTTTTE